jgi:hypothetical protein
MNAKGAGRPKKVLDEEQIRELAQIQCTDTEIAAVMRVSVDTIHRNYAELIKEGREQGKKSLRRAQFQKALEGNPAMLIWLGKFYLGQKEEITLNAGSEPEVRALLERWEVTAKKKSDFSHLGKAEKPTDAVTS